KGMGPVVDPTMRQKVARMFANAEVLRLNRLRTLSAKLNGRTPGTEASIQKLMADEHGQEVMELAKDLVGAEGMLTGSGPSGELAQSSRSGATEINFRKGHFAEVDPVWHYGFLFSPALTLGGGTWAIQRNIVAEMALGLPREPDVQQGMTWAETQKARA
ncbi:MAG: acyl-CoA dehydrogenase family protein, partial [Actinomycetota bacterium]|nr:acyl-CoA dehydrogenase family protein [Actinomycetota bacterium]